MAQLRSFRFNPLDIPPGYRTPSPPARAVVEPLTPFESTRSRDRGLVDEGRDKERILGKIAQLQARSTIRDLNNEKRRDDIPTSAPNLEIHNVSAMDAFATIALSVNQPYQSAGNVERSSAWFQPQKYIEQGSYLERKVQIPEEFEERPWKRARSEAPAGVGLSVKEDSRPATSHVTGGAWSAFQAYPNGEMSSSVAFQQPARPEVTQDAELLLNFMNSSGASKRNGLQKTEAASPNKFSTPSIFGNDQASNLDSYSPQTHAPVPKVESREAYSLSQPLQHPHSVQKYSQFSPVYEFSVKNNDQGLKPGKQLKPSKKETNANRGWPRGKPRGPRRNWAGSGQIGHGKQTESVLTAKAIQDMGTEASSALGVAEQIQPFQRHDKIQTLSTGLANQLTSTVAFERELQPTRGRIQRRKSSSDALTDRPISSTGSTHMQRSGSDPGYPQQNIFEITQNFVDYGIENADEKNNNRCAGCSLLQSSVGPDLEGEVLSWICCDGCKRWFHAVCTGMNDNQIKTVDKYSCEGCIKTCGPTTFVRKSSRAHASIDYAGLNEGLVKTSSETPEHPYIKPIKERTSKFLKDDLPRLSPDDPLLDNLEESGILTRPILIPAHLNPRPASSLSAADALKASRMTDTDIYTPNLAKIKTWLNGNVYEIDIPDDGGDALDMVIPRELTVRHVAELYGLDEKVEVIDVKSQGEAGLWSLRKWADYYESRWKKLIRNVISLEISCSKLGKIVRRPKMVRQMDLSHSVWPAEARAKGDFPKVQLYCLMSVADSFTDFHVDFGGSSVFYHIIRGKKTFLFIPPKPKHLKKYEQWCLSPAQNQTFLPDLTKECMRVDLSEGDTMLIPSGWIHAVWTPEDSLVIGGNFLTRIHYSMQIQIAEIEKTTRVPQKFRYPHFQRVMWLTAIKYIESDPTPLEIVETLNQGSQFGRNEDGTSTSAQYVSEKLYPSMELDGLPDLGRYLLRTALISMGKITDGITLDTKARIARAIPKGHGEPLDILKRFAVWTAWKRGNEFITYWAYPDYVPEDAAIGTGQKLSAAALRRLDLDASLAAKHRNTERIAQEKQEFENIEEEDTLQITKTANNLTFIGSKKASCAHCRKRRIRCKHRDEPEIQQLTPVNLLTIANLTEDIPTNLNVPTSASPTPYRPLDISSWKTLEESAPDSLDQSTMIQITPASGSKNIRAQACDSCRKSKRRCLHDENGQIDPVKKLAAEQRKAQAKRPSKGGEVTSTKHEDGTSSQMAPEEYSTELERDALAAQRQLEHSLMQASPLADFASSNQGTPQNPDGRGVGFGYNSTALDRSFIDHADASHSPVRATPVAVMGSDFQESSEENPEPFDSVEKTFSKEDNSLQKDSTEVRVEPNHASPITPPASLGAQTDIVMTDDQGPTEDEVLKLSSGSSRPKVIITSTKIPPSEKSLVKDSAPKLEKTPNASSPLTSTYSSTISTTPPLDSNTPTPTTTSEQNATSRRSSRTPKQTQLFSLERFDLETTAHNSPAVVISPKRPTRQDSGSSNSQIKVSPIIIFASPKRNIRKASSPLAPVPSSKRPRRTSSQTTQNVTFSPAATASSPKKATGAAMSITPTPRALTQEEKDEALARELQGMQFGLREGRSRR